MKKISVTLFAFSLIFCYTPAVSALTLSGVDGTWGTVTGGAAFYYNNNVAITYGNGLEDRVLWGDGSGKSGLGFTGIAPPPLIFNVGDAFEIGQLRHLNNPTSGNAATVDLSITLSFSDPSINDSYDFDFTISETPNNSGDNNDYIYFPTSYASQSYEVGGIDYTLQFLGFGSSTDGLISRFETPEFQISTTNLYGRITTAPVPEPATNAPVPEPATIILLGSGLIGLAGWSRRKYKKT